MMAMLALTVFWSRPFSQCTSIYSGNWSFWYNGAGANAFNAMSALPSVDGDVPVRLICDLRLRCVRKLGQRAGGLDEKSAGGMQQWNESLLVFLALVLRGQLSGLCMQWSNLPLVS